LVEGALGFGEFLEGLTGGVEGVEGEVEGRAVVGADEDVVDFGGGVAFGGEVFESVEIAEAFGHFAAIDHEVGDVEPVAGEMALGGAAGLGDFVFVVREDEVNAAGVEVEVFAEVLEDHGGALEVPAGAAFAPRAGPVVIAIFGLAGFPEGEIGEGVFGVFVVVEGGGGLGGAEFEFAILEVGEAAVVFEGGDAEVNGAVGGGVGVTALDEGGDHADLMIDVGDGAGLDMWGEEVQRGAIGVEFLGPEAGELDEGLTGFLGVANGFVVNIGDVANVEGGGAGELDDAAEDVLGGEGAEVTDVGGAIDGGAAAVEAEGFPIQRSERVGLAGEGVEEPEGGHGRRDQSAVTAARAFSSAPVFSR
jgi:hypothetical protein